MPKFGEIARNYPLEIIFLVGLAMFMFSILFTQSPWVMVSFVSGSLITVSIHLWKEEKDNAQKPPKSKAG